jgi:hypothetical protein
VLSPVSDRLEQHGRDGVQRSSHKRRGGKSGWPVSSAQAVLKLSKKRALWPNSVFISIQQCNALIY